jgi:hypothetical protein
MAAGRARKALFGTVAVVLGVAGGLLVAEMVLRLTDRPRPVVIGWTSGRPGEKNDFGFRGHRFDATARQRLILLGDSQVESETGFEDMPEVHLRRALSRSIGEDVSVVSIAAGGWGQDQELLALLAHIHAIRPTIVVLWFTAANDLWNNTFPTHFPKDGLPKPTFWLEGGTLKGPNVPWLSRYRPPGPYLIQAVRRIVRAPNYPTDADWEGHLPPPYRPTPVREGTRSLGEMLAERRGIRVDELPFFRHENFATEKTHASIYLVPESPRLKYSAALTRALLARIRDVCAENGAKFFVLQTESWQTYPEQPTPFEVRGKGYVLSSASARRLIDGVLDGLPTIRVEGVPTGAVISKTDRHLSREGNKYVMESLARQLVGELH